MSVKTEIEIRGANVIAIEIEIGNENITEEIEIRIEKGKALTFGQRSKLSIQIVHMRKELDPLLLLWILMRMIITLGRTRRRIEL